MAANLAEARSHNVQPAVFLDHYRLIRDAKDAHADTGMALVRAKKAAKAAGVDLDALKLLESLSKLDADEAAVQLRHVQRYARWAELPIGTQLNLLDGEETPEGPSQEDQQKQRDWAAGEAGLLAGKSGRIRLDNNHPAGSSEYVAWDKAWLRGNKIWTKTQGKLAEDLGKNAEAAARADTDASEHALNPSGGRGQARRPRINGSDTQVAPPPA